MRKINIYKSGDWEVRGFHHSNVFWLVAIDVSRALSTGKSWKMLDGAGITVSDRAQLSTFFPNHRFGMASGEPNRLTSRSVLISSEDLGKIVACSRKNNATEFLNWILSMPEPVGCISPIPLYDEPKVTSHRPVEKTPVFQSDTPQQTEQMKNPMNTDNNPTWGRLVRVPYNKTDFHVVIERSGKPWFAVKDISKALGFKHQRDVVKLFKGDDVMSPLKLSGQFCKLKGLSSHTPLITEDSMFHVAHLVHSRQAKKFKQWVHSTLLPAVFEHERLMKSGEIIPTTPEPIAETPTQASTQACSSTKNNPFRQFNYHGTLVRALIHENKPWFVAKDITDVFGYSDTNKLIKRLDSEDVADIKTIPVSLRDTGLRARSKFLSETGLYEASFNSQSKNATDFRRWIKKEVLPSLCGADLGKTSIIQAGQPVEIQEPPQIVPQTYAEALRALADETDKRHAIIAERDELKKQLEER